MRTLLFIVVAILCVSCRTDAQLDPIQTTPIIDAAEINAREDCLYERSPDFWSRKGAHSPAFTMLPWPLLDFAAKP